MIGEYLLLWAFVSLFIVLPLWCACMGDGASRTSDIIVTVIAGILGLPVTIAFAILFGIFATINWNK